MSKIWPPLSQEKIREYNIDIYSSCCEGLLSKKNIELHIRDRLFEGESSQEICDDLLQQLLEKPFSHKQKKSILQFAINCGQLQSAFKVFPYYFKLGHKIPWECFEHILFKSGFTPGSEFIESLEEAMNEDEQFEKIIHSFPWLKKLPAMLAHYQNYIAQLTEDLQKTKEHLYEKLNFQRNNRMIEQEKETLKEIIRLFPDDPEAQKELEGFKEKWARELINKQQIPNKIEKFLKQASEGNTDEQTLIKSMVNAIIERAGKQPQDAYNLSLALFFMELYEAATRSIKYAPAGLNTDWFFIELLFLQGHYVECLNQVDYIVGRYQDDPESIFASTYTKAQCYKKLGQNHMALKYIKSLLDVRPNYRAAQSLLSQWQRGID